MVPSDVEGGLHEIIIRLPASTVLMSSARPRTIVSGVPVTEGVVLAMSEDVVLSIGVLSVGVVVCKIKRIHNLVPPPPDNYLCGYGRCELVHHVGGVSGCCLFTGTKLCLQIHCHHRISEHTSDTQDSLSFTRRGKGLGPHCGVTGVGVEDSEVQDKVRKSCVHAV